MVLGRLGFLVSLGDGRLYMKDASEDASEHADYGNLLPCDIEYTAAKVFGPEMLKIQKTASHRRAHWIGSCNIPHCLPGQV
jgi:hypothetical protein